MREIGRSIVALAGRRLVLALAALAVLAAPGSALAQTAPPAPVRGNVDGNGVDLFYGTFNVDAPALSMGGAESGISFRRTHRGSSWTDTTIGYLNLSGSTMTVSIGPFSDSFTVSGGVYTSTEGNGSTLTYNGTSQVYTYTQADGTVAHFDKTKLNELAPYGNTGLITDLTAPDGEKLTYAYESVQYCKTYKPSGFGYICTVYGYAFRLASVTSSFGYRLAPSYSYTYEYNIDEPWNQPDWYYFSLVTGMNGLNLAVSPSTVQVSQGYSTENIGGYLYYVVTDGLGRQTKYKGTSTPVSAIRLPGSTSDDVTVTYSGSVVTGVTAAGSTTSYSRSDAGNTRTVTVTPPLGSAIVYTFDIPSRRMTSVAVNDGVANRTTSFTYDGSGRLTRTTYPEGNYVNLTRDARGNVTETRAVGKSGSGVADIVTTASYDTTCSNPKTCNQPNWTRDARNNQTDYTYDATHGGVLTVTAPADASGVRPQTRYGYTSLQAYYYNPSSIVASGVPVSRLTTIKSCRTTSSCTGGTDERVTTIGYGPQTAGTGNNLLPVSTTVARGDGALSATTAMTYSSQGWLKTVDAPNSGTTDTTFYSYDAIGRTTGVIGADPDGAGTALFPATKYTYRTDGQVDYAQSGTVTAQSDAGWSSFSQVTRQTYGYDSYHRPIRTVLTGGAADYQVTDQLYDSAGRVLCTMQRMESTSGQPGWWGNLPSSCSPTQTGSANGPDRVTYNHYDTLGRVWKVTEAYGITGQAGDDRISTFSANGKLATLTDAEGNTTTYEYDGHDRLVKTRFPSPTTDGVSSTTDYEQVGYDAASNVTSFRTRAGETLTMTFDNLNRMTVKVVPDRAGLDATHERDVYFGYDLFGGMTYARFDSTSGEGITNAFNALGQLTGTTTNMNSVSRTLSYGYDTAGNRTQVTHPDGNYFLYTRYAPGTWSAAYLNGSAGLFHSLYDAQGRASALYRADTALGSWTNQYTSFGYDAVSRLASFTYVLPGTTYDTTTSFTYNPASQIASGARTNDLYAWTGQTAVNRNYTANGLNQYSAVAGTSFGYDANGNLTSDGVETFTYDIENRLVGRSGGGTTATLRYDPLGRLYEVVGSATGTTRFLHDGSDLVAEYNGSGTLLRRYVHGVGAGDDPQVWFEGSGVSNAERRYLYADERGSVVAITNSTSTVLQVNTYDEYGIPNGSGNDISTRGRFRYTGQAWLPELGMYHYKARMYSPTLGRFMQTDPIGYGDGMNMYAYVGGDPVNGIDPTGLSMLVKWDTRCYGNCGSGYINTGTAGLGTPAQAANYASASVDRNLPELTGELRDQAVSAVAGFLRGNASLGDTVGRLTNIQLANAASMGMTEAQYLEYTGNIRLLTRLLFAEAVSDPEAYVGIGWSVRNRVGDSAYGDTYSEVIHQPGQYVSVGGNMWRLAGNPGRLTGANATSFQWAYMAASGVVSGRVADPTNGATHFFSGPTPAGWYQREIRSGGMEVTVRISEFTFLKEAE